MSLTSLLKDTHGPLWEWFEANFPETRRFGIAANRELRGGSTKQLCAIPPVPGTDHSLVGTGSASPPCVVAGQLAPARIASTQVPLLRRG